jgi:hypothetical protein
MRPLAWIALTIAAFVWLLVTESVTGMFQAAVAALVFGVLAMRSMAMWALTALEDE